MASLRHLTARGTKLTRTRFLQILESVGRPPRVAPSILHNGLQISGGVGASTISLRQRQIISAANNTVHAILGTSVSIGNNRWEYQWFEAVFGVSGWQALAGGRNSTDLGAARNKAEARNTSTTVAHGVIIPVPPPTITLLPIPILTPVTIYLLRDINNASSPWFSEVNAINVVC